MPQDDVEFPLTALQLGIWADEQFALDPAQYNLGAYWRIQGRLDPARLRDAIQFVVANTEALRLRLVVFRGQPTLRLPAYVPVDLQQLDFRSSPDPEAAAQLWMDHDLAKPFEPTSERLFSYAALQVSDECWLFQYKHHHLAMDGMSELLTAQRIAAAYGAIAEGRAPEPRHGHGWSEIVALDRTYSGSPAMQQDRDYWLAHCSGLAPRPTISTRTASGMALGGIHRLSQPLGPTNLDALRRLGKTIDPACRLNHVLFGLFYAYLARLTESEDLAIALPRANRRSKQLRETAGLLANVVLPRVQFPASGNLRRLLGSVSHMLEEATPHERYPFADLVRQLLPRADFRRRLHIAAMSYLPVPPSLNFAGAPAQVEILSQGPCTDLSVLYLVGQPDQPATLQLFCPARLYSREEAQLHLDRLVQLLHTAPAHLDTPLNRLPLLPAEERRRVLVDWKDTGDSEMDDRCIHELFEEQVRRTPQAIALADDRCELCYQEVDRRANEFAYLLRAQGVSSGDAVGLWDRWSIASVIGLLGILKTGAAYVPLPADAPRMRLQTIVKDAAIRCLVSSEPPEATDLCERCLTVSLAGERWAPADYNRENRPNPDGLACIIYTSGSTGVPKGVCVTHRGIVNVLKHRTKCRFQPGDFAVSPLTAPFQFDASLIQAFSPLITGGTLVVADALDSLARSRWYHRLTALTGAPAVVAHCLAIGGIPRSASVIGFGAEPIPPDLFERIANRSGVKRIITGYGVTECSCYSTDVVLFDASRVAGSEAVERQNMLDAAVVGRPIRNTQIYVLDSQMQPVPIGVPGELFIGGVGVARGYLNAPERTADRFVADPFSNEPEARLYRTGDRGRWRPDGNLEFLGRFDDQIKLRGHRIELGEIEAALNSHGSVARSVVVLRSGPAREPSLAAYAVLKPGCVAQELDWRRHLASRLPACMIPSSLTVVSSFPLTPNGKIDRDALREMQLSSNSSQDAARSSCSITEQILGGIWRELLGVDSVNRQDNFFDLGADSLLAARLCARVEEHFHRALPMSTLLLAPTIADLAHEIDQALTPTVGPAAVTIQSDGAGAPLYLLPSVGGELLFWKPLIARLGKHRPIKGLQLVGPAHPGELLTDLGEIARSFVGVILRHQSSGPYHLLGYSFGGKLAFEIARQLQAANHRLGMVAIVDTGPGLLPETGWGERWQQGAGFVRNLAPWLQEELKQARISEVASRGRRKLLRLGKTFLRKLQGKPPVDDVQDWYDGTQFPPQYHVRMTANARALRTYRAPCAPLRVVLFRARVRPLLHSFLPDLGWSHFAKGGVQRRELPGHHGSILCEPNVRLLAEGLLSAMVECESVTQPPGSPNPVPAFTAEE